MVKEHHHPDNETKVWYSTYLCLAVTRFLLILSPGYIHPDEFFQGGQVSLPIMRSIRKRPLLIKTERRNVSSHLCSVEPSSHLCSFITKHQEVWAAIVFQLPDCLIPWEFQPQHALRCITFP